MKKLLGIVVLCLLLAGCASQKTKQLRNDNPYMASVMLQKKGLNKTFREYGKTRADALFNAKETCRIAFKKLKVGKGKKCVVLGTYASNGRNWWPDASGPKVYKAKAKTSSSSSTIDPSVWDDLLGISEGLLGGKSVSESLGGASTSSSTSLSCFKKSESTSGTNKICIYNCMGSDVAINVKSTQLCPMSIKK
mgnify:CR=1 FL=1